SSASCFRAPDRMPAMPWFPSWHAYSINGSFERLKRTRAVHGRVHVDGSVMVASYCSVSAATRVKRSTRCRPLDEPSMLLLGENPFVSTTSVSPSQWPRELPSHWRIESG